MEKRRRKLFTEWSPRETVSLLSLIAEAAELAEDAEDLMAVYRAVIIEQECQPAPMTAEWNWRDFDGDREIR